MRFNKRESNITLLKRANKIRVCFCKLLKIANSSKFFEFPDMETSGKFASDGDTAADLGEGLKRKETRWRLVQYFMNNDRKKRSLRGERGVRWAFLTFFMFYFYESIRFYPAVQALHVRRASSEPSRRRSAI